MLRRAGALCVSISLLAALATTLAARADTAAFIDRDDSLSPLDIAAVEQGHEGRDALTFEVVTYESWDSSLIGGRFLFYISVDADRRTERYIVVQPSGQAALFKRGGEGLGELVATRPDEHSFRIVVEKSLLKKKNLRSIAWQVVSDVEDQEPPCDGESGGCRDWAPGAKRFIEHDV